MAALASLQSAPSTKFIRSAAAERIFALPSSHNSNPSAALTTSGRATYRGVTTTGYGSTIGYGGYGS